MREERELLYGTLLDAFSRKYISLIRAVLGVRGETRQAAAILHLLAYAQSLRILGTVFENFVFLPLESRLLRIMG